MREHADFAYFHADATARLVINTGHIDNYTIDSQTIVFADDSGKIYTHGGEFGGKLMNIKEGNSNGILVSKSGSEYTLSLDTDWLTLNFRPTNTGKTYTAGYAININSNNVISVNRDALNIPTSTGGDIEPATSTKYGGIKIGFDESNASTTKQYAVKLNNNGQAFVYVPWQASQNPNNPNPDNPDNPDDPNNPYNPSSNPTVVRIKESEFLALQQAGQLKEDTLYIVTDDDGNMLYMWLNGNKINIIHGDDEPLTAEKITKTQWDSLSDEEKRKKIYIITNEAGDTILGIGTSGVYTKIPVPANGTIERLSQAAYDEKKNASPSLINEGTLYLIVNDQNAVVAIYLGTTPITFSGTDEGIIKSILTTMFSQKITWEGNVVKSLNYSIIDVDNPGDFYAKTGFADFVKGTISESGFISKTDNTDAFAEMFAENINSTTGLVKKASIIANINESNETNIKISADKINVDGVFDQKVINGRNASQIVSDAAQVSTRVLTIENGYMKVSNINQESGKISLQAIYLGSDDVAKNVSFDMNVDASTSKIKLTADQIQLDGAAIANSLSTAQATIDNCTISDSCTINGTLNYSGVIGKMQVVTSNEPIATDITYVKVQPASSDLMHIYLPYSPVDGRTLFIYVPKNAYVNIRPQIGNSASVCCWNFDTTDEFNRSIYKYNMRLIDNLYSPNNGYVANMNLPYLAVHQYIYNDADKMWYEMTSFNVADRID